ncbi:29734_t:CDS:1, partial [Racocetra persica]
MLESNVILETILKVILYYISYLDRQIKYPFFIINIDKTNILFESEHSYWLQEVLRSFARIITDISD